jgi:DNA-binding NarL/FixJ family response regulator
MVRFQSDVAVTQTLNILLAGGRRLLREGLAVMLERHAGLRVVGDASDLASASLLFDPLEVDVLLVTGSSAFDDPAAVEQIQAAKDRVRVVALLYSSSAHAVRTALAAGAVGCLAKECDSADLLACVRAVATGETYVSPQLRASLVDSLIGGDPAIRRPLAPRERDVLRCIASGMTTKEIAASLGIGTKTVETHRRRLMEKLERKTIAELTQYAMTHGILNVPVGAAPTPSRRSPSGRP